MNVLSRICPCFCKETSTDTSESLASPKRGCWLGRVICDSYAVDAGKKLIFYIADNWKQLVLFIIAWVIIIGGTGLMYGFKTVALPLTCGLGGGLLIGLVSGIVTVVWIDPNNELSTNTMWGLINTNLNQLSPNGTRPIVLSVAVTVVLAATVVFPIGMGIVLGVVMGNHLSTSIGHYQDNSLSNNRGKLDIETRLQHLEEEMARLKRERDLDGIPGSED